MRLILLPASWFPAMPPVPNISMRLLNSKKPKASLQWKIGEGSSDCDLTKFDDFAFYNLLERWRKDPAQRKINSVGKKPEKPKRK